MKLKDLTTEQIDELSLDIVELNVEEKIYLTRDQTLEVLHMLRLNLQMRTGKDKL